jgi:hypothetical protein
VTQVDEASPNRPRPLDDFGLQMRLRNPRCRKFQCPRLPWNQSLLNRPSRPPDYKVENSALVALTSALGDSPRTILQTLADKVLEVLQADSAGLSLLTKDEKRFYWAAIAGAWQPHIGGGTPRDFGPCGDVLDRNDKDCRSTALSLWDCVSACQHMNDALRVLEAVVSGLQP